ncbi:MAG: hypothetical protein AAFU79_20870, partial [Myxococcota bacterium]
MPQEALVGDRAPLVLAELPPPDRPDVAPSNVNRAHLAESPPTLLDLRSSQHELGVMLLLVGRGSTPTLLVDVADAPAPARELNHVLDGLLLRLRHAVDQRLVVANAIVEKAIVGIAAQP